MATFIFNSHLADAYSLKNINLKGVEYSVAYSRKGSIKGRHGIKDGTRENQTRKFPVHPDVQTKLPFLHFHLNIK